MDFRSRAGAPLAVNLSASDIHVSCCPPVYEKCGVDLVHPDHLPHNFRQIVPAERFLKMSAMRPGAGAHAGICRNIGRI
jgi:hypothetical protein